MSFIRRLFHTSPTWIWMLWGLTFWGMQHRVSEHDDWSKWLQIPYGGIALTCFIIIGHRIDHKETP